MTKRLLMFLSFIVLSLPSFAKVKIEEVDLSEANGKVEFSIKYTGDLGSGPKLMVRDSIVQVELENAVVWPRINKEFGDKTILAYQYDKDLARVRALLKYSLSGHEDQVEMQTENNLVKVTFPMSIMEKKQAVLPKVSATHLDEAFLAKILKDDEKKQKHDMKETVPQKEDIKLGAIEDRIETSLSGIERDENSVPTFSLFTQLGKFAGFLGLILAGLYGIVWISRRGMFSKGKFSFLSNMKAVSVMNRIPLGHKRDLLLIKVGEQVLLLGSTDHNISLITKIDEAAQVMKDTELALGGSNFDTQFDDAKVQDKEMKLKADPLERLKDKVKNLRPLQ